MELERGSPQPWQDGWKMVVVDDGGHVYFTKASRQARQSCPRERSEYRGCGGGELDEVAKKTTVGW